MENSKKWFWVLLDVLIVAIVINVVFFVMPMLSRIGSGVQPTHTLVVSAIGKTTAGPDLAELSFSVLTQGQNPETLATNNNKKMNAVLDFVKTQGIADADIKTTGYNLAPDYQWDKDTQRNFITGYTLTQTVTVKVRDLSKVASVLGGLAPLGVNQIGGVNFTFANDEQVLGAARADAFAKATAKAKEMAQAAGVKLGRVVSISENNYVPGPIYYAKDMAMGMGGASSPTAPTIQPGTQEITDNVTIVYEVR